MSTLLDTNVVSELMRESPDRSVARWVSDHPLEDESQDRGLLPPWSPCAVLRLFKRG